MFLKRAAVLLFALSISSYAAKAQDPVKNWVTLESNKKEFSVSVPPDFIVTEESERLYEQKTVWAFTDGVRIEVGVSKDLHTRARAKLPNVRIDNDRDPKVLDFEFEGIPGKYITFKKGGWESRIYFASGDWYYRVEIAGDKADSQTVIRFLDSIRIKGKQFLAAAAGTWPEPDTTLLFDSLEESPEIKKVKKQKAPPFGGTVQYRPLAEFKPCPADAQVRPAVLASSLKPEMSFRIRDIRNAESGEVRVQYELRADGSVGDVRIFSDVDRSVLRGYAEGAKRLRFLPATKAGVPVDFCDTMWSAFGVTTSTRMFTIK
jgi:hypothetical protein